MTHDHIEATAAVQAEPVPAALTFLLALACGITVANIYYVQPVTGLISRAYGLPLSWAGALVTITQIGYAAGLLFVVPLGDILENKRLILVMLCALVLAVATAFVAPNIGVFLAASLAIGVSACTVQIIVPFAGHLASDETRGRIVGNVVSGLLFGIMLSRPAASFFADMFGPRSIFGVSAVLTALLIIALATKLPERRPNGMPYLKALASLGPMLRGTTILHRRAGYQAAMFGAFSVLWTAVPLLLEGPVFQFSQAGIGVFALVGAGGALVSPYAGRAADAGHTKTITAVSLLSAAASFLVALLGGWFVSWPLLVVAALILDAAVAANLVVGQREIFALGSEARGRLNGLFLALFFLGGAFGSFAAGIALAHGGWTAVSLVGVALPALAFLYFLTE